MKYAAVSARKKGVFTLIVADTPEGIRNLDDIRSRIEGVVVEGRYAGRILASLDLDRASAVNLLREPFVIGLEDSVPYLNSDERQAISLTGASSPVGGNYLGWLSARGITPSALTMSNIIVDVADTGLDYGCTVGSHPDLGRTVYHTTFFDGSSDTDKHGTIVAGIIGGSPGSGVDLFGNPIQGTQLRDADSFGSFYWGLGVAPGVRLGVTRMSSNLGGTRKTVKDWTTSAVTSACNKRSVSQGSWEVCTAGVPYTGCRATVQNHSHNKYSADGSTAGKYTVDDVAFDLSVRNATHATTGPFIPLTITVSAGNFRTFETDPSDMVLTPATAKNVISVGAGETRRTAIPADCLVSNSLNLEPTLRHAAEGYNVLAYCSRRGVIDGRIKPDVIAPGTLALGPNSPNGSVYCAKDNQQAPYYNGSSGTSFSAPVAAGSIALLRYFYGNRGLVPSPAMFKAMLVAGARSIKGSPDRRGGTVTGWPNSQQGWGMINLQDLLDPGQDGKRGWYDQSTVLLQGETFERTVRVADGSKPVRVVLTWTDAPGTETGASALTNDLDLEADYSFTRVRGNIFDANGWSYQPGCGRPVCGFPARDFANNVEMVTFPPGQFPTGGTFLIRVRAYTLQGKAIPGMTPYNQDFAVFAMNGTLQ